MPKDSDQQYNFGIHIYKVLKQVHPDMKINSFALSQINLLIHDILKKLLDTIKTMDSHSILSARTIQNAIRLNFPGELAKHAVSEGTRAITRFSSSARGTRESPRSMVQRARLQFPPSLIKNIIKEREHNRKVSPYAAIYAAAILEYISAEILELSGNGARDHRNITISTRHIHMAINATEELSIMFKNVTLGSGVIPNIHTVLLPRRKVTVYKRNRNYNQWKRRKTDTPYTRDEIMNMSVAQLNEICKNYKVQFCWGGPSLPGNPQTHNILAKKQRILEFFDL